MSPNKSVRFIKIIFNYYESKNHKLHFKILRPLNNLVLLWNVPLMKLYIL